MSVPSPHSPQRLLRTAGIAALLSLLILLAMQYGAWGWLRSQLVRDCGLVGYVEDTAVPIGGLLRVQMNDESKCDDIHAIKREYFFDASISDLGNNEFDQAQGLDYVIERGFGPDNDFYIKVDDNADLILGTRHFWVDGEVHTFIIVPKNPSADVYCDVPVGPLLACSLPVAPIACAGNAYPFEDFDAAGVQRISDDYVAEECMYQQTVETGACCTPDDPADPGKGEIWDADLAQCYGWNGTFLFAPLGARTNVEDVYKDNNCFKGGAVGNWWLEVFPGLVGTTTPTVLKEPRVCCDYAEDLANAAGDLLFGSDRCGITLGDLIRVNFNTEDQAKLAEFSAAIGAETKPIAHITLDPIRKTAIVSPVANFKISGRGYSRAYIRRALKAAVADGDMVNDGAANLKIDRLFKETSALGLAMSALLTSQIPPNDIAGFNDQTAYPLSPAYIDVLGDGSWDVYQRPGPDLPSRRDIIADVAADLLGAPPVWRAVDIRHPEPYVHIPADKVPDPADLPDVLQALMLTLPARSNIDLVSADCPVTARTFTPGDPQNMNATVDECRNTCQLWGVRPFANVIDPAPFAVPSPDVCCDPTANGGTCSVGIAQLIQTYNTQGVGGTKPLGTVGIFTQQFPDGMVITKSADRGYTLLGILGVIQGVVPDAAINGDTIRVNLTINNTISMERLNKVLMAMLVPGGDNISDIGRYNADPRGLAYVSTPNDFVDAPAADLGAPNLYVFSRPNSPPGMLDDRLDKLKQMGKIEDFEARLPNPSRAIPHRYVFVKSVTNEAEVLQYLLAPATDVRPPNVENGNTCGQNGFVYEHFSPTLFRNHFEDCADVCGGFYCVFAIPSDPQIANIFPVAPACLNGRLPVAGNLRRQDMCFNNRLDPDGPEAVRAENNAKRLVSRNQDAQTVTAILPEYCPVANVQIPNAAGGAGGNNNRPAGNNNGNAALDMQQFVAELLAQQRPQGGAALPNNRLGAPQQGFGGGNGGAQQRPNSACTQAFSQISGQLFGTILRGTDDEGYDTFNDCRNPCQLVFNQIVQACFPGGNAGNFNIPNIAGPVGGQGGFPGGQPGGNQANNAGQPNRGNTNPSIGTVSTPATNANRNGTSTTPTTNQNRNGTNITPTDGNNRNASNTNPPNSSARASSLAASSRISSFSSSRSSSFSSFSSSSVSSRSSSSSFASSSRSSSSSVSSSRSSSFSSSSRSSVSSFSSSSRSSSSFSSASSFSSFSSRSSFSSASSFSSFSSRSSFSSASSFSSFSSRSSFSSESSFSSRSSFASFSNFSSAGSFSSFASFSSIPFLSSSSRFGSFSSAFSSVPPTFGSSSARFSSVGSAASASSFRFSVVGFSSSSAPTTFQSSSARFSFPSFSSSSVTNLVSFSSSSYCPPNICFPCSSDSQCPSQQCINGICAALCGNGRVDVGESCDDANSDNNDGCSNNCKLGITETCRVSEQCDTGLCTRERCVPCNSTAQCPVNMLCLSRSCVVPPMCGNGVVEWTERCDDGNRDDNDLCSNDCRRGNGLSCVINRDCASLRCVNGLCESCSSPDQCDSGICQDGRCADQCGNGQVDRGEQCDQGQDNSDILPDRCRQDCQNPRVGDGVKDANEECDDGNTISGDGCDRYGRLEGGTPGGPMVIDLNPVTKLDANLTQNLGENGVLSHVPQNAGSGPAAVAVMASGAAAGWAWMRRRRHK